MALSKTRVSSTVQHGGTVQVSLELDWRLKGGDERITKAIDDAVNDTMDECVEHASKPSGHPRWQNRTYAAQRSVGIKTMARGRQPGWWGSTGVFYAVYLEFLYGPWLRWAADITYPSIVGRLTKNIEAAFSGMRGRAEAATRRRAGY